jgi:hypothetical protein
MAPQSLFVYSYPGCFFDRKSTQMTVSYNVVEKPSHRAGDICLTAMASCG